MDCCGVPFLSGLLSPMGLWERCCRRQIHPLQIFKITRAVTRFSTSVAQTLFVQSMTSIWLQGLMQLKQIPLALTGPTWPIMELKIEFTNLHLQVEKSLVKLLMLFQHLTSHALYWVPLDQERNYQVLDTQPMTISSSLTTQRLRDWQIQAVMHYLSKHHKIYCR